MSGATSSPPRKRFRLHLTNVTGIGAVQIAASLLPAFERAPDWRLDEIYLPDRGPMSGYQRLSPGPAPIPYRRRLPRGPSRFLECALLSHRFDGEIPLLVLGDVPLRSRGPQLVFVQSRLLIEEPGVGSGPGLSRFGVMRALFRANVDFARGFIVQTPTMRHDLGQAFPSIADRIHVVAQPPPKWLLDTGLKRTGRIGDGALRLFYPAADYPHKNHALFVAARGASGFDALIAELVLTVPPSNTPEPAWVRRVGGLGGAAMAGIYAETDALVFPSKVESYGLPLIEAMWIGLPIVVADLPYARDLCGEQAIYFDPDDVGALRAALSTLKARLDGGWWPDWSKPLQAIPRAWDEVAGKMLGVIDRTLA